MCYVHLENTCYGPGAPPSTPPSPHTPDTFRKFKRLPVELRCMIWSLAPDPRVVEVVYCKKYKNWFCPRESHHPPSGLLLANKVCVIRPLYLSRVLDSRFFLLSRVLSSRVFLCPSTQCTNFGIGITPGVSLEMETMHSSCGEPTICY